MKHRFSPLMVWLLMAVGFVPAAVAQLTVADSLTFIEHDLELTPATASRVTVSDPAKRALAAANFALASELENSGQLTDALAKYQLAAAADPGYVPIHTRIAILYIKLERLPQAAAFLREKESSFPDSAEIKTLLAYLQLRQDQPDKALTLARAAQQLNPRLVAPYHLLSQCYLLQNQAAEIQPLMEQSLTVSTDQAAYYARLGDLWMPTLAQTAPLTDSDIAAKVLPFYEKARQLNPANLSLAFHLGQLHFILDHHQQALACYEPVWQKTPAIPGLRERMSICHLALKQPAKAIAILESLLDDHPDRKNLYPMIAELYEQTGEWQQAVSYYQLYEKLGQPDARHYFLLANAQTHCRQFTDALDTLRRGAQQHPAIPALRLYQAIALRQLERWDDALAVFAEVERQYPGVIDSNFYFDYAATCEKSGREEQAAELFKKCLVLNPDHHQAMNYLGYMWAAKGARLDEAGQLIARALTLDAGNPAYLDSMAWVHYQKQEYDQALAYQQQAVAALPDDAEILEHLADIHYKLGNLEKAVEAWSKASAQAKDPAALKGKIQAAREQALARP